MSYICDIYNIKTTTKSNLNKHKLTESCKKIKNDLEYTKNITELNNKIQNLTNELNLSIKKMKNSQ